MAHIEVNETIAKQKKQLQEVGNELIDASQRFGLDKDTQDILETQIININDNFLFVIAGEVNAGKSSFVNALLGAEVCATSHEICTNDVQKITYGETEKIIDNPDEKFATREFPADILKQITIVDTPGTNSKELDHQIITEKFIPHANLIMFVFMTENIHAETAWNLFRNIKDKWGKKVVFVLTKKDMYTPEQQESYKSTLRRYVQNEGIEDPKIFVTSSFQEEKGETEQSGFAPLREFINEEVLNNAASEKIKDDYKTLNSLFGQLKGEFDIRRQQFENDNAIREDVRTIIQTQEDNVRDSIQNLTDRCLEVYDRNTNDFVRELNKEVGFVNLTMRSIRSIFGGEKTKEWLERMNKDFTTELNRDMNRVIEEGTDSIKNDIQYMLTKVKAELDRLPAQNDSTLMFSHLDHQRNEIVKNLKYNLTNFIEKSPLFSGQNIIKDQIDYSESNIASGVGLIAGVITAIAQHSVFDVTGGIATTLAFLAAGGFAQFKKGKYIKQVKATFAESRVKLRQELEGQLLDYFNNIRDSINSQFFEFDQKLKTERVQIKNFEEVASSVKEKLVAIEREVII